MHLHLLVFLSAALASRPQALQNVLSLTVNADEVTRAKHLARVHAVAMQAEHFKRRTVLKVYIVELLSCFKLGIEHILLLLPTGSSGGASETYSADHTPRGLGDLLHQTSGAHQRQQNWSPLGSSNRRETKSEFPPVPEPGTPDRRSPRQDGPSPTIVVA